MATGEGTVAGVDERAGAPMLVFPPRGKLVLLAATCGFFAVVSWVGSAAERAALAVVGTVGLVVFSLAAAVLLVRAVRPGPTVRIDAVGVTDRTTLFPTGRLRWEEIAAVRKREIGRGWGAERMLELVLLDPDGFRARPRTWPRRLADRYRALLRQPDVTIPGSMVSVPLGRLIEEMRRWQPELCVLELPPPRPKLFRRQESARQRPQLPPW